MEKEQLQKLNKLFKSYPKVKLVYFFGSRASGDFGPMSDYDFAVYIDSKDENEISEMQIILQPRISIILKTDNVDVVMLNICRMSLLKYEAISKGKIIYEKESARLDIEPKILNEYFDHCLTLKYCVPNPIKK